MRYLHRHLTRWTWSALIVFALAVTLGAQLPPTQVNNTAAQLAGKTLVTAEDAATVTGLYLFSRSTNPPFAVNANAGKVTNLDADLLDTQTGSYYLDLANATSILNGNQGGTGVNNSGKTVTLGGNLIILGSSAISISTTAATSITLPTSGTLLTTTGSGTGLTFGGGALSLGGNLTLSGASATTLGATGATSITLPTAGTLLTTTGSLAALTGTLANAVQDLITRLGTITSGVWTGTTIAVANGGTSATSLTANNVVLGNGTGQPLFVAPSTSGNFLTSNGTTWTSAANPFAKGYTPTVANVQGTAAITTICSFTVAANDMASGDVMFVEMPSLLKNNKGTAGTITWTFSWNGTTVASAAQTASNSVTEYRVGYTFKLQRVGADLWITGGTTDRTQTDENLYLTDVTGLGIQSNYLITAPDFTTSQAVLVRATLSAADAAFYIKPQVANVYKVTKQ